MLALRLPFSIITTPPASSSASPSAPSTFASPFNIQFGIHQVARLADSMASLTEFNEGIEMNENNERFLSQPPPTQRVHLVLGISTGSPSSSYEYRTPRRKTSAVWHEKEEEEEEREAHQHTKEGREKKLSASNWFEKFFNPKLWMGHFGYTFQRPYSGRNLRACCLCYRCSHKDAALVCPTVDIGNGYNIDDEITGAHTITKWRIRYGPIVSTRNSPCQPVMH